MNGDIQAANAVTAAVRLAAAIEYAIAEIRRAVAQTEIPQRELAGHELELELVRDDLLVIVGDLADVARDLRRLAL